MIVCHCTAISDTDILSAIKWMRAADAHTIITPGKVYRALGKRPECGDCLAMFIGTMQASDGLEVPMQLRGLRRAMTQERRNEGRRESHRIPQRGLAE